MAGIYNVFHVSMLRKCLRESEEYIEIPKEQLQEDLTYKEYPTRIIDTKE